MSEHSAASLFYPVVNPSTIPDPPPSPADDSTVNSLVASQPHHSPFPDHLIHRQDSINWILHAHAHYQFKPATAILAINYLDRFLSSASLPVNNRWVFQLLSVACLSLAAKMEESDVPMLLDLQISEPRFIFEPKTVQRMELRVMANLNWRLRSVTPFDYLHYFTLKLQISGDDDRHARFRSACSDLIINTTRVIEFLRFPPSVIAAAAVIFAAGGVDIPESFYEREMVRSCHQLMEEFLVDTCPSADHTPASPDGVLDAAACVSCDTRSNNPTLLVSTAASGDSGQAEPPNKRLRSFIQEEQP